MGLTRRSSHSSANSYRYEELEPRKMLACDTPLANLNSGVAVSDDATGIGYMMYSEERVQDRFSGINVDNADHFICSSTRWDSVAIQ